MLPASALPAVRPAALLCHVIMLSALLGSTAAAQVEVAVQAGVHPARLARPERTLVQPGRGVQLSGAPGEATAFSVRLGTGLGGPWSLEGGVSWSLNRSWNGAALVGSTPDFETHTIFSSATVRTHVTRPDARLGLTVGVGPALIFHRGSGTSLLARQTDLGAVFTLGAALSLDGRLAFRVDAQQYLFSSAFSEAHTPAFIGAPVQPAGSQFRREFVLLAGVSWRGA